LHLLGSDPEQATLVHLTFDEGADYARYQVVTDEQKGDGMLSPTSSIVADALVATTPGHALFLPVADCAGVVLYDPTQHVLMMSHIGRHSAIVDGAAKSVAYLEDQFGSRPADILAWLSPAAGKASYPLFARDGKGLHEVIVAQLLVAGLTEKNIEISPIDTTTTTDYFSHSEFLAGHRTFDGRFAIVAEMRVQGEPVV
jgi:copper oxidase (laccase) domain-containing protein